MSSLAIILPVHNELMSLEAVIQAWDSVLKKIPDCAYTFIACEDGSTDGTPELIKKLSAHYPMINLSTPIRRGYGNAVIEGIMAANTDFILCIDSDGQCLPNNFMHFWENKMQADFIMGWRFKRHDSRLRIFYSHCFFVFYRFLFKTLLHDPSCPYVLGRREAFLVVKPYLSFLKEGFWWGFVAATIKMKKTIFEIKIEHSERLDGKTRVYRWYKMPGIIVKNMLGLIGLKLS